MFQEFLGAHGRSGMLTTGILRIMALYCVYLEGHGDLVSRSRLESRPILNLLSLPDPQVVESLLLSETPPDASSKSTHGNHGIHREPTIQTTIHCGHNQWVGGA